MPALADRAPKGDPYRHFLSALGTLKKVLKRSIHYIIIFRFVQAFVRVLTLRCKYYAPFVDPISRFTKKVPNTVCDFKVSIVTSPYCTNASCHSHFVGFETIYIIRRCVFVARRNTTHGSTRRSLVTTPALKLISIEVFYPETRLCAVRDYGLSYSLLFCFRKTPPSSDLFPITITTSKNELDRFPLGFRRDC